MLTRFDVSYMKMAAIWGQNSYSQRHKVGCLVVKDNTIISDGYNGTPSGMENVLEDENGETKWYVLHSEANALMKLARNSNASSVGATIYTTFSPCRECSKLIFQAGIKRLVYRDAHSDQSGVEFLKERGVEVIQIEKEKLT